MKSAQVQLHTIRYNGRVIPLNFNSYLSDFLFAITRKTANFGIKP